jgi:hypothetical protein
VATNDRFWRKADIAVNRLIVLMMTAAISLPDAAMIPPATRSLDFAKAR